MFRYNFSAPFSADLHSVTGIEAGDLDGDGDLDSMVSTVANGLAMYYNDGAGAFSYPHRLGVYWNPWSPVFEDFDGDELPDLAMLVSMPPSGVGRELVLLPGRSGIPTAEGTHGPTQPVGLPGGFALNPAYSNPFGSETRFILRLAETQTVRVELFDLLGRRVRKLMDRLLEAGVRHDVVVDGSDLPAGSYIARFTGESFSVSERVAHL